MTVLCAQSIRVARPIEPFFERHEWTSGSGRKLTFGLGPAGYDVRAEFDANEGTLKMGMPPGSFLLASTIERFSMPNDLIAFVHDKSSWARQGLAVQNTVIEPGWCGHLTLELSNHSNTTLVIERGCPIAQIIFHQLDFPTLHQYDGKYQNQGRGPKEAL